MTNYILFYEDDVIANKETIMDMVAYLNSANVTGDLDVPEPKKLIIRSMTADKNGHIELIATYTVIEFLSLYGREPEEKLHMDKEWFLFGFDRLLEQAKDNLRRSEYQELLRDIYRTALAAIHNETGV